MSHPPPPPSTMHVDTPAAQSGMHARATHRCLSIPEVLALICEACIDPPDVDSVAARNRGMRSLVRLARTCKTIYAVAIRFIWQNVTEIAILAEYTMPGCWEIIRDHPEVNEGVLSSVILPARSIQEEDLKRFRFHAAFIKMSFGGSDWQRLFVDDCIIALCLTAVAPLLPNLTQIEWDVELNLIYLQYFASPTVLELRINGGSLTVGDAYILRSAPRWFPNLTDLYLGYSSSLADGAKQAIDILGEAICGWKLRRLETSHINAEALRRLAELPSLCALTLEGGPVQIGRAVNALFGSSDGPRLGFPKLSDLVVKTPGLRIAPAGSRDCCMFPALETLELGFLLDVWQATFMHISSLCPSRPRLRRLVLEDEDHPAAGVSQPIPATDIRLLGPYTHLEELILTSLYGFHVDEADVLWIARSWPQLRVLHLRPKYRQRDDARRRIPPLHALRHLARHCPRLADLAIEVDATAVPLAEAPTDAVQMELRLWRAGWSPITAQNAPYVAAYLSVIFPCVQNIVSTMPGATLHVPENLNWREVCSLIPVFNAVQGHAYRRLMHGSADSGEVVKRMVGLVE